MEQGIDQSNLIQQHIHQSNGHGRSTSQASGANNARTSANANAGASHTGTGVGTSSDANTGIGIELCIKPSIITYCVHHVRRVLLSLRQQYTNHDNVNNVNNVLVRHTVPRPNTSDSMNTTNSIPKPLPIPNPIPVHIHNLSIYSESRLLQCIDDCLVSMGVIDVCAEYHSNSVNTCHTSTHTNDLVDTNHTNNNNPSPNHTNATIERHICVEYLSKYIIDSLCVLNEIVVIKGAAVELDIDIGDSGEVDSTNSNSTKPKSNTYYCIDVDWFINRLCNSHSSNSNSSNSSSSNVSSSETQEYMDIEAIIGG